MRSPRVALLLIAFSVMLIFSSLSTGNRAVALTGTGAGIRIDGPLNGYKGETLVYVITVFNLGDFWIRNVTVTDRFPNGTSSSWNITDLAPLGQLGDSFQISGILYVVQDADMPGPGNFPYITNHAEFVGSSDIQGQDVLIGAQADYLTLITERPAGGYSVTIGTAASSAPTAIYLTLLFIATAAFSILSRNTAIAHAAGRHRKRKHACDLFLSRGQQ